VNAFFNRAKILQSSPRHPKWRELNLGASLAGWERFPPAETWLRNAALGAQQSGTRADFETFLRQVSINSGACSEAPTPAKTPP
jgi:uncharacterized protein